MKKRFSFSRLLHNDKLMMIVCLVLAIITWALVDENRGFVYEVEISGVPVTVELSEYAEERGLRVVEGGNRTATVKVSGTRAELKGLKASDITVIADAQAYLHEGEYQVSLSATSARGEIVGISGGDIDGDRLQDKKIWIRCQRYVSEEYVLTTAEREYKLDADQIALSGLQQDENVRVDSVVVEEDSFAELLEGGKIRVYGPAQLVEQIDYVSVDLSNTTISQTDVYTVPLRAYDGDGRPIEGLTFEVPKSAEIEVRVEAIVYHEETFSVTIKNPPEGFDTSKIVVAPSTVVLGELSAENGQQYNNYIKEIKKSLVIDFNTWQPEKKITIPLEEAEGVYLDRTASQNLTVYLDMEGYSTITKTMSLTLGENVLIECDDGLEAELLQDKLPNVVLCGPKKLLKDIDGENILITIDAKGQVDGQQMKAKITEIAIELPLKDSEDVVWVCYGSDGYEIAYAIHKVQPAATIEE